VRDAYYASADALLLCFNFGSQKSYWNVLKWENEVRRVCPSVPIVVVGCGADNSGHIEGGGGGGGGGRGGRRSYEGAIVSHAWRGGEYLRQRWFSGHSPVVLQFWIEKPTAIMNMNMMAPILALISKAGDATY
jgi:hypothetical protein